LALVVAPAPATVINDKAPIPELVGSSEVIVIAKVAKIQKDFVTALPTRNAKAKEHYQIVELTVTDAIQGAKDEKSFKMGVVCGSFGAGGKVTFFPAVNLKEGQEALFFLNRHHSGDFLELQSNGFIGKELNITYTADVDMAKKCAKLIAEPEE